MPLLHLIKPMAFLIPILITPIILALCWIFNSIGNFTHTTSEQVRLDAYTLSICHQRAAFIKDEIETTNLRIETLQIDMDTQAELCDETRNEPYAGAAVCSVAITLMLAKSAEGKALEAKQEVARIKYALKSRQMRSKWREKNHLTKTKGELHTDELRWEVAPSFDGFRREIFSGQRLRWQFRYPPWPRKLEQGEDFDEYHRVNTNFRPRRGVIGVSAEMKSTNDFSFHKNLVRDGGASQTFAGCEITDDAQVRRIR